MAEKKEDDIFSQFPGEIVRRTILKQWEKDEIIEYINGEVFGQGGFSICYKCINNTKEIFILKEFKIERNQKRFCDELEIHRYLEHPNIVKLNNGFEYERKLYLLLEYCENKDFFYFKEEKKT